MKRFATLTRKNEKALLKVPLCDFEDGFDRVIISFRWPPGVQWVDANNWIQDRFVSGDILYLSILGRSDRRCAIEESSIEFGMDGAICRRFTLKDAP